jgi:hypothetical protein
MCIRRETREKARQSLAFPPVSKPHTDITYMVMVFFFLKNILIPNVAKKNILFCGEKKNLIPSFCHIT